MRPFTKVVLSLTLCLGIIPGVLFAHEFSGEKNIAFTFHVEPADHPVQGVATTMFLGIEDKEHLLVNKKKLNCQCVLTISHNGNTEQALSIINTSQLEKIPYTFKDAGSYTVTFSVQPKPGEITPAPFEKSFPVYVSSPSTLKRTIEDWIVGSIAGVFLVGVLIQLFRKKTPRVNRG